MDASGCACSVGVSGMRNDRRVAPDTTEGALGLPVTPRGVGAGWETPLGPGFGVGFRRAA